MNKVFKHHIGHNMKVYVDDMLVKSYALGNHIDDLKEIFTTLHRYKMKLNPDKCTFRVMSRKFLRFMVSLQESEANEKKI